MGRKAVGLRKMDPTAEQVLIKFIPAANRKTNLHIPNYILRREVLPLLEAPRMLIAGFRVLCDSSVACGNNLSHTHILQA